MSPKTSLFSIPNDIFSHSVKDQVKKFNIAILRSFVLPLDTEEEQSSNTACTCRNRINRQNPQLRLNVTLKRIQRIYQTANSDFSPT